MAQKITSLWNSIAPDFSKLEHFSAAHEKTQEGAYWASLQLFHHILAKNNREDPLTDQSMPLPLIDTLLQIGCILRQEGRELPEDNLQRILQLCCSAVSEILEHPRQKLLRSHPFLPVSKVREMDTRCMAWLAKQPGKRVREKIGVKQHILGVRRKISADTIENRVLRRLIDELKPMIERRLDIVHHYSISDRDYIKLLQKMLHICSDALYSSALKDVPSSHTLQANNVLLSDRAYNKVWRAFKRLQEYQNRVEQIWKDGPNQFTIMAFWLFIARLYERTHVLLYDDFCLLQPGLISSLFGIQAHLKGSWQAAENPKLSLTVSLGNSLFDLDMEVKGNAIHIDSTRLYEADGYIARSSQSPTHNCRVELNFLSSEISDSKEASSIKEFWIQRGFAQGRYMPFTGQFYWNEGELEPFHDFADILGLRKFTDHLISRLFLKYQKELRNPIPFLQNSNIPLINQMGLDVSSVIPRISTESGKISSECRLYSSPVSLPDGTTEWLAGYKEKKLDPWNKEIVHFSSVWDDSDIEDTTLLHSLQKTMASLAKDVGLSNRAQIALAIPDTLDELAHQPIRHAISSTCEKLYLPWRSVAGALGWQTLPEFAESGVQKGDAVVVVDAEAPVFTATCLIAMHDRRLDDSGACGIYWQRKPAFIPLGAGEKIGFQRFSKNFCCQHLENLCQKASPFLEISQEQIDKLVAYLEKTGLAETFLEEKNPLLLSLETKEKTEKKWIKLQYQEEIWRKLSSQWYENFKIWLKSWRDSEQAKIIKKYTGKHRIHLLFVGRPFHNRWIRERVGDYLHHYLDFYQDTKYHIPEQAKRLVDRGLLEFLNREKQGLPSYEDWLPDLYLEVLEKGIPKHIQIFESRSAQPGQEIVYNVQDVMELTANQPDYRIPLIRDKQGRYPISYEAKLEHPSFPWSHSIYVKMQVAYKYGLDSYRLLVKPVQVASAPFQEIEFQWGRKIFQNKESLKNIPPQFPQVQVWEGCELKRCLDWFLEAEKNLEDHVANLNDYARRLKEPAFINYYYSPHNQIKRLLDNIRNLIEKKLLPCCLVLWQPDKDSFIRTPEFDRALEKAIRLLTQLAKLYLKDETLQETTDSLNDFSWETLSFLRGDAPIDFLDYLEFNIRQGNNEYQMSLWLGRVLGNGKNNRRNLFQFLLKEIEQRFEHNRNSPQQKKKYSYLLRGLATALWRNQELVHSLEEVSSIPKFLEILEYDYRGIIKTLKKTEPDNQKLIVNQSRNFRNLNEILMALLRLRSQEIELHAGNSRMLKISQYLREIDVLLLKFGQECKSCFRFEWEGQKKPEGMSELVYVLNCYLTGEAMSELIRIKTIADSNEAETKDE